jgi:hypothetical protein
MQHKILICILLVLGALLLPGARAQQTLGAVSGTITDSTGAAIPGASITLVNDHTAASRTTTSNGPGGYSMQDLSIGT